LKWQKENPDRIYTEDGIPYERCIQFATLCREEGRVHAWQGPVTALELELELEFLTEKFFGKRDKIGGTIVEFKQFSGAQRRLLMYIFDMVHKVWLRHKRATFSADAAVTRHLSGNQSAQANGEA
jgi:hypothetical protein